MSTPPPIPGEPKRKTAKVVLVICACISTLAVIIFVIGYLDRVGLIMFPTSGPTAYYYPDDLKDRNLPVWRGTNAIPLTPDQAVLAATRFLSTNRPSSTAWELESIDLRKDFDETWIYSVSLIDRRSDQYAFQIVRVLMDGSVWMPTKEKRVH